MLFGSSAESPFTSHFERPVLDAPLDIHLNALWKVPPTPKTPLCIVVVVPVVVAAVLVVLDPVV